MSRLLLTLALAGGILPFAGAGYVQAADEAASAIVWTEDWDAAKQQAAAANRDVLIDFTGSDWCHWCVKLHEEVFSTPEFSAAVKDRYVFVMLDFPRDKEQSSELKARNQALKAQYAVEGFPTIYLADATGRPYARTGYKAGGGSIYAAHLVELQQRRVQRDTAFTAASAATGVDQAKQLDAALMALGDDVPLAPYRAEIDRIIAGDADGAAGLKPKYVGVLIEMDVEAAVAKATDPESAMAAIEAGLATPGLPARAKQNLLLSKAGLTFQAGDKAGALTALKAALAAAPESDKATMLKRYITQLGGDEGSAATPTP